MNPHPGPEFVGGGGFQVGDMVEPAPGATAWVLGEGSGYLRRYTGPPPWRVVGGDNDVWLAALDGTMAYAQASDLRAVRPEPVRMCPPSTDYHALKADKGKPHDGLIPAQMLLAEFTCDGTECDELLLTVVNLQRSFQRSPEAVDDYLLDILSLIPYEEIVAVLEFGERKYSRGGWVSVPDAEARYHDALVRHARAISRGEETDPESGLPHRGHLGCCAAFLLDNLVNGGE